MLPPAWDCRSRPSGLIRSSCCTMNPYQPRPRRVRYTKNRKRSSGTHEIRIKQSQRSGARNSVPMQPCRCFLCWAHWRNFRAAAFRRVVSGRPERRPWRRQSKIRRHPTRRFHWRQCRGRRYHKMFLRHRNCCCCSGRESFFLRWRKPVASPFHPQVFVQRS